MHTVDIDGETLTVQDLLSIARGDAGVRIAADSIQKIEAAHNTVVGILKRGETVYGINTGFGALVNTTIPADKLSKLQVNLIRSHACALGEYLDEETTRAVMVARANSLAKGNSGVRVEVIQQILDYLEHGITPLVPRIGSLGASGDLAPLSHIALALIGEGEASNRQGEILPMSEILMNEGLIPLELQAKEGLSLINGTSLVVAWLANACEELGNLLPIADIILACSIDARSCSIQPFDERVHNVRAHLGQELVANRVRQALHDSAINSAHLDCDKVQDPYSFRCAPQVHGPIHESFERLHDAVVIDLNSATDNPLVFPNPANPGPNEVISQGNFHAEVLALAADAMSLGCFELGSISERRIDQILDASRSGLPPFLARDSGLESGLMIVQYVAAASLSELRLHSSPATAFNVPTSANQEDHVSMGATAAWSLCEAVKRLSEVLACELFVALEALEHSPYNSSPMIELLRSLIRRTIPPLDGDRSTSLELRDLASTLRSGTYLTQLEAAHGRLARL